MTWTRLGDEVPDALLERSDAAFRLHIAAICYANRLGLDGRISKPRLQLIPVPTRTRRAATIRELVDAGLWLDDGDAYVIVDFLRDQPSAEEVALQREWDALRQQIRFAKGPDRAEKQADLRRDADAKRDALQALRNQRKALFHGGITSESQRPVPIRPVPARPAPSEGEAGNEQRPLGAPRGAQRPRNETCPICSLPIDPIRDDVHVKRFDQLTHAEQEREGPEAPDAPFYVHDSWSDCVKADLRLNGTRTATA